MKNYTAWIIHNGFIQHEKFTTLFQHLLQAALDKEISCKLVKHHEVILIQSGEQSQIIGKYANEKPDFIIFWDKDIQLAKQLEALGIPLYNDAKSIEICDHKGLMHIHLSQTNIPMPKTIMAPHVFPNCQLNDPIFFEQVIDILGLPLIVKEAYGSFGFQVYMAKTKADVIALGTYLQHKPHLYQQYMKSSHGKDIRLQVVGGQVVAAMHRRSEKDFKANITNGGIATPYTPTEAEKQLAIQATHAVGATFAGVDLLFGENNRPLLCEINTNAHFINLLNCTGIDVAPLIIEAILEDMEDKKIC